MRIFERRDLTKRNRAPARERNLQVAQRRERHTLLIGSARNDIDLIDIIAYLRYRSARVTMIDATSVYDVKRFRHRCS